MLKKLFWVILFPIYLISAENKENPSLIPTFPSMEIQSRISYDVNGYELGDNLMSYLRSKWISFHYNIPLLFKPFPFANQFNLYTEEKKKFHPTLLPKFEFVHTVNNEFEVCFEDPSSILYLIPTFQEPEVLELTEVPSIEIDWETKNFQKMIKKLLKPVNDIPFIHLPRQRISIAVYIPQYEGSAQDSTSTPLQSPSDSYYIEQINKLSELFYHRPLYVYLFTETRPIQEVLKTFQERITAPNIMMEGSLTNKMTRNSYVEDFINMGRFDCLIRPLNNQGYLLEKINDYLITVKPIHFDSNNNIDQVEIKFRNEIK